MYRKIVSYRFFILMVFLIALFLSIAGSEATEKTDNSKDGLRGADNEIVNYIKSLVPILTNVDITIRNIGMNLLPIKDGIAKMDDYIKQATSLKSPAILSRDHKMLILSFRKMRMGLLLFSPEKKEPGVSLIRNGAIILKHVANDIVAIGEKEGIIKKKKTEDGGDAK